MTWIKSNKTRMYPCGTEGKSSTRVRREPEITDGVDSAKAGSADRTWSGDSVLSETDTDTNNLYPRRASVSMKRGLLAESPSTSRSLLMIEFKL